MKVKYHTKNTTHSMSNTIIPRTYSSSIYQLNREFAGRIGSDSYDATKPIHIHRRNRAFVWKKKMQEDLLDTILKGYYIPPIICSVHLVDGRERQEVMEGGNRITTFRLILEDKVRRLSPEERQQVNDYQVTIVTMRNLSSLDQRVMFRRLNKNVKVSDGQLYAMSIDDSPLVQAAEAFLRDSAYPFRDRITRHFTDTRELKEKDFPRELANVVALISGILYGPNYLTTSYNVQDEKVELQEPVQMAQISTHLTWLFDLLDEVDRIEPLAHKTKRKSQLTIGKYMGVIMYDRLTKSDELNMVTQKWTRYLVQVRQNEKVVKEALDITGAHNLTAIQYAKMSIKVQIFLEENRMASTEEIKQRLLEEEQYEIIEPGEDSDDSESVNSDESD